MDHESVPDEEISRLSMQTVPNLEIGEITDSNRETVIAFLRFFLRLIAYSSATVLTFKTCRREILPVSGETYLSTTLFGDQ